MKDAELRAKLLKHFYDLRDKNGGWVPATEIIVAPDLVSREAIANACQHLADAGLIRWELFTPVLEQYALGKAKITGSGIDVVTGSRKSTLDVRFPEAQTLAAPITMAAVKEPERINLAEALAVLASDLPATDAKVRLRDAFTRKAFSQWPCFALAYDEAEIDWTTGSVKIPRKREPFIPTFSRAELNAHFLQMRPAMLGGSSENKEAALSAPSADYSSAQKEVLTLKPAFMGMSIDLKELARRVIAWWKTRQ
jgi:hypothetical protein